MNGRPFKLFLGASKRNERPLATDRQHFPSFSSSVFTGSQTSEPTRGDFYRPPARFCSSKTRTACKSATAAEQTLYLWFLLGFFFLIPYRCYSVFHPWPTGFRETWGAIPCQIWVKSFWSNHLVLHFHYPQQSQPVSLRIFFADERHFTAVSFQVHGCCGSSSVNPHRESQMHRRKLGNSRWKFEWGYDA